MKCQAASPPTRTMIKHKTFHMPGSLRLPCVRKHGLNIAQQKHRHTLACFAEQFEEDGKIAFLVEQGAATITSVEDVITIAALRGASRGGMKGMVPQEETHVKGNHECPLSFLLKRRSPKPQHAECLAGIATQGKRASVDRAAGHAEG